MSLAQPQLDAIADAYCALLNDPRLGLAARVDLVIADAVRFQESTSIIDEAADSNSRHDTIHITMHIQERPDV